MKRPKKPDVFAQEDFALAQIIAEFGFAMWRAERHYISSAGKMTPAMEIAWGKYVDWCANHAN